MSKLNEYLKLIPEGLKNLDKVIEGVVNDSLLSSLKGDQKAVIIHRRAICQICPYMSNNAKTSVEFKNLTGENYKTSRTDEHCTMCGCPLQTRTASLSSNCGIEKHNISHPSDKLPLKWEKYEN